MSVAERWGPIPDDQLSPSQRAAYREVATGPRGAVYGPFVPLLRSPRLMRAMQATGAYLRYDSPMPRHVFEFCVLAVAAHWRQAFEWAHHLEPARTSGVPPTVIDALAAGAAVVEPPYDLVGRFVAAVLRDGSVDDRTFDGVVAAFGDEATMDLLGVVGYYSSLALIMNVARTPPPADGDYPRWPDRVS